MKTKITNSMRNHFANVICAKKSFMNKGYKQFLVKNEIKASISFLILDLFSNFKFFHVFLVKVLSIILDDQNRNSSNFAIFSCKMDVTFESSQDILCLETWRRQPKNLNWKKKLKINFFLATPILFLYLYIFKSKNSFKKNYIHG